MKAYYSHRFVLPLPQGHRFPMDKYRRLHERIAGAGLVVELLEPPAASDDDLLRVHTPAYLRGVIDGTLDPATWRRVGFPWSSLAVERSRRSCGGTLAALTTACAGDGIAVNLAGGTHHAFYDRGEGFCVFNDTVIAARAMQAEGRARELAGETQAPAEVLAPLRREPPPSHFARWFGIALMLFLVGGFARGSAMGLDVVATWVLTTGILGALGAAVAGAHPASIASAFVASPLTPLHPALASGMVSGAVELWARKPRVGDFQRLRDDVVTLRGWWRNRVARVFLVFFLTSLGTAIGVWVAGFRMAAKLAG